VRQPCLNVGVGLGRSGSGVAELRLKRLVPTAAGACAALHSPRAGSVRRQHGGGRVSDFGCIHQYI